MRMDQLISKWLHVDVDCIICYRLYTMFLETPTSVKSQRCRATGHVMCNHSDNETERSTLPDKGSTKRSTGNETERSASQVSIICEALGKGLSSSGTGTFCCRDSQPGSNRFPKCTSRSRLSVPGPRLVQSRCR